MLPFPIISNTNVILPRVITKIAASSAAIYVLMGTGNLYACGNNAYRQFGTLTANTTYKAWQLIKSGVQDFYVGSESCLVHLTDGTWQYGGNQRLSGTTDADNSAGVAWTTLTAFNYFSNNSLTIKKVQVGGTAIGVLCTNNTLYQMGYNSQGNFGTGITASQSSFIASRANTKDFCLGIVYSLATDLSTGILWRAGWNQYGQIGYGSTTASTSWVSSGVVPVTITVGRYTSSYVTSTGTVSSTGDAAYGAIANGYTSATSSPVTSFTALSNGLPSAVIDTTVHHTKVWNTWFRTSAGIYATGRNDAGQLSIGNTTNIGSYQAIQMPSGVKSTDVEAFEISTYCSIALMNDGRTLYVAGNSTYFPGYTTTQTTFVPLVLPE